MNSQILMEIFEHPLKLWAPEPGHVYIVRGGRRQLAVR